MKKIAWYTFAFFSSLIGLYPVVYFLIDRKFGLLSFKSNELLSNALWNMAFYGHIIWGGIALLIGWIQFSHRWRTKHIKLHRNIGKVYVSAVFISSISGLYIALYATGGMISSLGFISLSLVWLTTTILGLRSIYQGKVDLHEKYMMYSYASSFAAVTLRIWLPLLVLATGSFISAYKIVAWLCWIPNIVIVWFIIKNKSGNYTLSKTETRF